MCISDPQPSALRSRTERLMPTASKFLLRCALAALLVGGFGLQAAGASEYFVAPAGSDENGNGTTARPWKTLDFAVGKVPANAGHTIRLAAGTHDLFHIAALPSGVNLIGAGKDKTLIQCKYFFDFEGTKKPKAADWLPDAFDYDPSAEKSAILQINGKNQIIQGFTLDGQEKKCIVGALVSYGKNLTFDDLAFRHFKISGLWLHETYDVEIKNATFRNNSWGNKNQAFGALQFNRADRLFIHDNDIAERGSGCYGIKMVSKKVGGGMYSDNGAWREHTLNDDVRIYNNRIEVDENGTWSTNDGKGHAPAIAIELNSDIEGKNINIHHNWLNNHCSIVSWEVGQATSYHIHHNIFDLRSDDKKGERYAYMIEANESNYEIDHNMVLGGYYPIATWHNDKSRNKNHLVHHNVFYGPAGKNVRDGLPFFLDLSGHDGYQFYNNTVVDTRGCSPIFTVSNPKRNNINAAFKNNIFVSIFGERGDILGNANALDGAAITNNLFYNIKMRGEKAIMGDPLLNVSDLSFTLQKGSPAIHAGVAIPGITGNAAGAPDLGAFAYGQPAWTAGILKSGRSAQRASLRN